MHRRERLRQLTAGVIDDILNAAFAFSQAPAGEIGEFGRMMWERLTFDDIVQAKAETNRRRTEILARQAEEMRALAAEEAEVEALDRLIDEFAGKFGHVETAPETVPASDEAVADEPAADEPVIAAATPQPKTPASEPVRSSRDRRDQKERSKPQTVFDTFSRALSRNL